MKTAIIIPVFNEGEQVADQVRGLVSLLSSDDQLEKLKLRSFDIVIVDDGSLQALTIESIASELHPEITIHILRHLINLGQGAAIQTGIQYSRKFADLFVTLDADGQHDVCDLPRMLDELLLENLDIVFGNRFGKLSNSNTPKIRRWLLRTARYFEYLLTGVVLSDAHNGYRAFNRNFALNVDLKQNRMAHATEFKQLVSRFKANYGEVDVSVTYSMHSLSKGQRSSGSLRILKDLFTGYLFDGI